MLGCIFTGDALFFSTKQLQMNSLVKANLKLVNPIAKHNKKKKFEKDHNCTKIV